MLGSLSASSISPFSDGMPAETGSIIIKYVSVSAV